MIFIVKKDYKNPYILISKNFLADKNLSAKAKGILGYILHVPSDYAISVEELSKHFTDGHDSINAGIKELIQKGYIIREQSRNEKGKFTSPNYYVFEVPIISQK